MEKIVSLRIWLFVHCYASVCFQFTWPRAENTGQFFALTVAMNGSLSRVGVLQRKPVAGGSPPDPRPWRARYVRIRGRQRPAEASPAARAGRRVRKIQRHLVTSKTRRPPPASPAPKRLGSTRRAGKSHAQHTPACPGMRSRHESRPGPERAGRAEVQRAGIAGFRMSRNRCYVN